MSPDESTDAQPPLPLPLVAVSGLCMGAADAVPGVSGGTIALILGVYQRFIEAIGTCLKVLVHIRSPEGRTKLVAALRFLVPLGVGVVVGRSDEVLELLDGQVGEHGAASTGVQTIVEGL